MSSTTGWRVDTDDRHGNIKQRLSPFVCRNRQTVRKFLSSMHLRFKGETQSLMCVICVTEGGEKSKAPTHSRCFLPFS